MLKKDRNQKKDITILKWVISRKGLEYAKLNYPEFYKWYKEDWRVKSSLKAGGEKL